MGDDQGQISFPPYVSIGNQMFQLFQPYALLPRYRVGLHINHHACLPLLDARRLPVPRCFQR
jgi:hypothetical protein